MQQFLDSVVWQGDLFFIKPQTHKNVAISWAKYFFCGRVWSYDYDDSRFVVLYSTDDISDYKLVLALPGFIRWLEKFIGWTLITLAFS